jgi:endoglucanase
MDEQSLACLKHLLSIPGPSGEEMAVARAWRAEASSFADEVSVDVRCNSYAHLRSSGPRVLLAGHIDEIGLMITYIDDDGFLYFDAIGGWDAQVLVGQRVRLLGQQGDVPGVVGRKPIHLLKGDERGEGSKLENLWIDIGARSRAEVQERMRVGAVGVIDVQPCEMLNSRLVSRCLDNRVGAFVVLEVLRRLHADRPAASVTAVATAQEELGAVGAVTAAYAIEPHVALAVDVTFTTDHPETNRRQDGDVALGAGPVLSRGAANSPLVYARLVELAEREQIAYSLQSTPRGTGTDADTIHKARGGVATAMVCVPLRYMHSPCEMIDLRDVEQTIRLITAFVRSLRSENEFLPV